MLHDKSIRLSLHEFNKFRGLGDDGLASSPGEHGHYETGNFYVLLFGKPMGNANRIISDERGSVIMVGHRIQPFFELGRIFGKRIQ